MLLILVAAAGAGWWRWRAGLADREHTLAQAAEKAYQEHDFHAAAQRYQQLLRDFADSDHAKWYAFRAELSDVRAGVYQPHENFEELYAGLGHVLEFLKVHAGGTLLKTHEADAWQTLHDLADVLLGHAESKENVEALRLAQRAWQEASKYSAPASANAEEADRRLTERSAALSKVLEAREQRRRLLDQLEAWRDEPTIDRVVNAKRLGADQKYAADADIRGKIDSLVKAHRARVVYVPNPAPPAASPPGEDPYPSLALATVLGKSRPIELQETHRPVLALVRGVLYAIEPSTGEIRWVRRLGIDTTHLPIRLPADETAPARLLLLSSDQSTLCAAEETTGTILWSHSVTGVCLAPPVVVGHHALLATHAGRIEEIDLRGGRMHGWYQLDQALPLGGTRMPGSPRVYFPGDKECLYEIDVAARACTAIFYTAHPPGTLAGLPTPLLHEGDDKNSFLLWAQRKGSAAADIQPFQLPDWRAAQPRLQTRGWAAMGLHADSDQIVLATDSGLVSIWGCRQKGNSDPLLFPRVLENRIVPDAPGAAARSLVAHVERERLWIIAQGKLHSLRYDPTAPTGSQLEARWGSPPVVGSPLHEAQTRRNRDGKLILYLATQDDGPRCRFIAIDGETGEFFWQRQLGLIADGDGFVLPSHALLTSGPVTYSVARADLRGDAPWCVPRVVAMIEVEPNRAHTWQPYKSSWLNVSWPIDAKAARELHWRELGQPMKSTALPDLLQGPPVVGATCIVAPLRNGESVRIPLDGGDAVIGRPWRAAGAEDRPALAAHAGADRFVIADGRGGLALFDASNARAWERKGSASLPFRISTPPLVLGTDPLRVLLADASDTLTLLEGDRLLKQRSWRLGGKLSAGPFAMDRRFGCIVDGRRLVVFEDGKDEPCWENTFLADVIGMPRVRGEELVVADGAGSIHFFDASNGEVTRGAITLKANVAPTLAPLPLNRDEWLTPLTDGTAMILRPK